MRPDATPLPVPGGRPQGRPAAGRGPGGRLPTVPLARGRLLIVATGAIAVTQLPEWAMLFRVSYDWSVRVCLTRSAEQLVSRHALAAITQLPVEGPEWDTSRGVVPHQELAEWPDLVLVAPAGTQFIAKCAAGMPDSLALATVICTRAPVVFAPAVPEGALARPSVRRNLKLLEEDGHYVVPAEPGLSVHSGARNSAAMPSLMSILRFTSRVLADRASLGDHGTGGTPPDTAQAG